MSSVKRIDQEEKDLAEKEAEMEAARIDPDDMGCGQRCFFTYGQMCQRTAEMFNCCLTDYEEAMQKERRWEETVRLKERVLKQRDHLVRLEREQKQLQDRMTTFQTETTELIEETGENVRKELKKAFRMEVDISTKELMRKHERLAREQNTMADVIEEHEQKLTDLNTRTDKIKRELNETFLQLQDVDQEVKKQETATEVNFKETNDRITHQNEELSSRIDHTNEELKHVTEQVDEHGVVNNNQNLDISRIKKALEMIRQEQMSKDEPPQGFLERMLHKGEEALGQASDVADDAASSEGGKKKRRIGLDIGPPALGLPEDGIAGKMKFWGGGDDDLSETDLPTVPDDEPVERPKYYEFMIHTPSEGETPSEYEIRTQQNEIIAKERAAFDKQEKRNKKKRAKRKKIAEQEKTLRKKNTKVAASGAGGASLPAHVTNAS